MKWIGLLMALIVGCIGTALFIGGCVWGYQRAALYLEGAAVQGQVVGNLESGSRDGYSYRPVVEFVVAGERKHRLIDDVSWDEPPYKIGSSVKVLYDPKYPEAAVIARFRTLWLAPLFMGLLGILFFAGGVGLFFHSRSSDKSG